MAEKPAEEGYISVVDEEPEIFELLKWDNTPQRQKQQTSCCLALEESVKVPEKKKAPGRSRDDVDPFELPDPTFIDTYRLSKDVARNLCEDLKPVMPETTKSIEFSVETKVLAALSFFATGKYQKSIAGKTEPNITQYFVSSAVQQVTEAMNDSSVMKKYLHFPHLKNERDTIKARFYSKYGMPNVVGSIDCTHVPMARPEEDQKLHFNKSYHSKKVQIICDSDLYITSVDPAPGSLSHDAILHRHPVKNDLDSLNNSGEICWLVGGAHYQQKKYIMVPIPKVTKKSPVSPEKYYIHVHNQTHSAVTETIKHLKTRWKCLQASCNKQFDASTVSKMIIACCMLHNICNRRGLPLTPFTPAEERLEAMKQKVANGPVSRKQTEEAEGVDTRSRLVEMLWSERRPDQNGPKKRMSKKDRILEHYQMPQQQAHPPPPPPQHLQAHGSQPPPPQAPPTATLLQHEDPSKRPRLVMSAPGYPLGVAGAWGHFPHH